MLEIIITSLLVVIIILIINIIVRIICDTKKLVADTTNLDDNTLDNFQIIAAGCTRSRISRFPNEWSDVLCHMDILYLCKSNLDNKYYNALKDKKNKDTWRILIPVIKIQKQEGIRALDPYPHRPFQRARDSRCFAEWRRSTSQSSWSIPSIDCEKTHSPQGRTRPGDGPAQYRRRTHAPNSSRVSYNTETAICCGKSPPRSARQWHWPNSGKSRGKKVQTRQRREPVFCEARPHTPRLWHRF